MTQEEIFLESEGDRWFERNIYKMGEDPLNDPIIMKIMEGGIQPARVLEVGCSNGWRLAALKKMLPKARFYGVDPSTAAISNGMAKFKDITVARGTATAFRHPTGSIDLLIYGFCLYVCDPADHFEIVTQGNNVLTEGGHLIIHDFDPEFAHSVPNHHVDGLMTYKMNFANLFLAHPAYAMMSKTVYPDGTAVTVLRKSMDSAFPEMEYKP